MENNKGPDFIIIGAAKSGTTSLHRYLERHPKIFMSQPKEPEFFARDDRYGEGLKSYEDLFANASSTQLKGEASTLYSGPRYFEQTAERIFQYSPNMKLVYVLRNPIDRAYSYYVQLVKNYQNASKSSSISRTFEEFIFPERFPSRCPREDFFAPFDSHLRDEPETVLGGGYYYYHVQKYLNFFNRDQILLLEFDELNQNPKTVLNQIYKFLGIQDEQPDDPVDEVRVNVASEHFSQKKGYQTVSRVKNFIFFRPLINLLPEKSRKAGVQLILNWSRLNGKNDNFPPKMLDTTRDYLRTLYQDDIKALQSIWGRDLSHWN